MRQPVPFGKYLLLDRISVGGMAEVFKAKSYGVEGFEKIIAIKRILPTMGEDRDFIKMFIDEAKIAGQLAHANICQIFELGRIDGSHFIAMEYIWGKDLLQIQNRLRKVKQPMPVAMACFAIAKVLEGLDYAHRKRDAHGRPLEIVHRDCSPQNVLVSYEGEVKVIDFGIAKATSRNSRTMAGVLKGKFGYMSPEQVRGLPLDRRSDIFALGTMLYECLTGERLFQGETDFSTLEKVRNVDIQAPRAVNPAIPEAVEKVILKALAKDVDDRYQWCSDMLGDLQQFLMSQDVVFTAKTLSGWLKEIFTQEIDRERAQLEQYKRVGRDGLIGGLPSAEADRDVVGQLGEAGAPEGDATTLGGPSFEEMQAMLNSGGAAPEARATTSPDEDGDFGEEMPTEIFGDDMQVPAPPGRSQPSQSFGAEPTNEVPRRPSVPRSSPRASTQRPAEGAAARPPTNTPPNGNARPMTAPPPPPQPQPPMVYGQASPPAGQPQPYANPQYGYPPGSSDPVAVGTPGGPFPAGQPPQASTNRTVLGMAAPVIPTQVPPNYPFRTPSGQLPTQQPMQGNPYPGQSPYPQAPMPNGPYPQAPMSGAYPSYPPPYGNPSGAYQQPYGMNNPSDLAQQVEPKRSTLVRDVLIGVVIAVVVLGGFFAIKLLVLDKKEPAASGSSLATIQIALTPGVTADLIVDDKKLATVVDGNTVPVTAGKRHVALVGRTGTKCDEQVTLDAGKTVTLKCELAAPVPPATDVGSAAGSAMAGPAAGSAAALASGSNAGSAMAATGSGAGSAMTAVAPATGSAAAPIAPTPPPTVAPTPPRPSPVIAVAPPTPPPSTPPPAPPPKRIEPPRPPKAEPAVVKPADAGGKGFLTITSKPSAHILVDGQDTGLSTPVSGKALPLAAGRHKITFVLGDDRYTFPVTISGGQTASLSKDLE